MRASSGGMQRALLNQFSVRMAVQKQQTDTMRSRQALMGTPVRGSTRARNFDTGPKPPSRAKE